MGQYYKAMTIDGRGNMSVFNPQNAICMTANGMESFDYRAKRPEGYWDYFDGMKLMEHSWQRNRFVNGVVEDIWDTLKVVAWVGDYADEPEDFKDGYTERTYKSVWEGDHMDRPFREMPEVHANGYLLDLTKGEFVDLARYYAANGDGDGWHIHPLPLLTVIGNGRGGGDYLGTNMDMVGSWAMDRIMFTEHEPSGMLDVTERTLFREG